MGVTMLVATAWLDVIGRSLREGFFMFWVTLWPLILGFCISGAVQSFATRTSMRTKLGDRRPSSIARATGYGMVSSSCSYASAAMAKSVFAKGADFVAACVFMFASTNLVVELGIVLVVLMGWQFAASEFVGGVIMIVLLSSVGALWLRGRVVVAARDRVTDEPSAAHDHGADDDAGPGHRRRLRSPGAWADAASFTMGDLTMLRRELLVGYTVAGFLAVAVPAHVWSAVFIQGHGFWTSVENVLVGPFIAVVSFVCSIGNVPLAAALWAGGISFGGVVSFLFADLIALPLLLIYRRYYGSALTLRMLVVFWGVMSLAGLLTEGVFLAAGAIPTSRPATVAPATFAWNYTTYLNIVFLSVLAVVFWASRNRARLGGGSGYAIDPVCGMQVEVRHAPAQSVADGVPVYFCSEGCRAQHEASTNRPRPLQQIPAS